MPCCVNMCVCMFVYVCVGGCPLSAFVYSLDNRGHKNVPCLGRGCDSVCPALIGKMPDS